MTTQNNSEEICELMEMTKIPESNLHTIEELTMALTKRDVLVREQRKMLEKSLSEWICTFDAMNDGVCLMDPEFHIQKCNKSFLKFTNLETFEEVIGKRCPDLLHGIDKIPDTCAGYRSMMTYKRETEEIQINGIWYVVTVDPVWSRNGKELIGFVHTMRDITIRMRAMDELRKANERFRSIVERIQEVVLRWRPDDGFICFSNKAAQFEFGERLTDGNWFLLLKGESVPRMQELLNSANPEEPMFRASHRIQINDHIEKCYQFVHTVIFNPKREAVEVQSVGRDTTQWVEDYEC
jgi:PAS domain S-box-containing protein